MFQPGFSIPPPCSQSPSNNLYNPFTTPQLPVSLWNREIKYYSVKADFSHLHNGSSLDCGFTASKGEWVDQLAIKNVDPLLGQNFNKISAALTFTFKLYHSSSSSTTYLNKHILQNASNWSGQFADMHWERLLLYLPSITDIKMGPLDIWYLSIILLSSLSHTTQQNAKQNTPRI